MSWCLRATRDVFLRWLSLQTGLQTEPLSRNHTAWEAGQYCRYISAVQRQNLGLVVTGRHPPKVSSSPPPTHVGRFVLRWRHSTPTRGIAAHASAIVARSPEQEGQDRTPTPPDPSSFGAAASTTGLRPGLSNCCQGNVDQHPPTRTDGDRRTADGYHAPHSSTGSEPTSTNDQRDLGDRRSWVRIPPARPINTFSDESLKANRHLMSVELQRSRLEGASGARG